MLSAHCANTEASVQWFWPHFCANPQRIPPIFHKSANLFNQTRQSDFPLWTPRKWEWDDQLLDYWWYCSKNSLNHIDCLSVLQFYQMIMIQFWATILIINHSKQNLVINRMCLGIPNWCILGYSLTYFITSSFFCSM